MKRPDSSEGIEPSTATCSGPCSSPTTAMVVAPERMIGPPVLSWIHGDDLVLVGLGGLIVGVSSGVIVVGVLAFVAMVGGVVLAATPARRASGSDSPRADRAPSTGAKKATGSSSFMDRMNDRWDRRQGER